MTHSELKELQGLQYEILKYVDRICKKNNIEYFLIYGTLLGAVRHQGTIPWDYDIDIAMTRENHKKFIECAEKESDGHKFIGLNYNETMDYCGEFRVVKYHQKYKNVYIDVFLLDYAKKYNSFMIPIIDHIVNFLYMAKLSKNEKSILRKQFGRSLLKQTYLTLSQIANIVLGGSAHIERFSAYLKYSKKQTDCFYIGDYCGFRSIETFRPAVLLKYEDAEYPCPNKYKDFLRWQYGDWESFPKEGLKWLDEDKKGINL